jgi:hypothetical protein
MHFILNHYYISLDYSLFLIFNLEEQTSTQTSQQLLPSTLVARQVSLQLLKIGATNQPTRPRQVSRIKG